MNNFMVDTFGSAWAYYVGFAIAVALVWLNRGSK